MRFPKTLTVCCLFAGFSATTTFAQDADAQQRALDALRQYTAEKEGRASTGLTTEPTPDADSAAQKELEQKAREAAVEQQPEPAQTATDETEQERRAREALDDLRRADPEPAGNTSTVVVTEAPGNDKEAAARAALEAQYDAAPADNTLEPTLEQQARQQLDAMTTQTDVPTSTQQVMAKPKPKTKKEKLADLLELYMDNSITPREYHDQRAMIIAGN